MRQGLCNGTCHLSVPSIDRCMPLWRVCYFGTDKQKISIDSLTAGAAVARRWVANASSVTFSADTWSWTQPFVFIQGNSELPSSFVRMQTYRYEKSVMHRPLQCQCLWRVSLGPFMILSPLQRWDISPPSFPLEVGPLNPGLGTL